jgi:hypothetical protein
MRSAHEMLQKCIQLFDQQFQNQTIQQNDEEWKEYIKFYFKGRGYECAGRVC